jgi:hypothetical protein
LGISLRLMPPLPPGRERMSRVESYAIISARMSSTGYCKKRHVSRCGALACDILTASRSKTNLGDGAVVDLDKVAGSRVHLQALVESQSGINGLGS